MLQVMVGGKNVRELELEDLRKATAVVPQDTALFNETIAYNIAYARPSSTEVGLQTVPWSHIYIFGFDFGPCW